MHKPYAEFMTQKMWDKYAPKLQYMMFEIHRTPRRYYELRFILERRYGLNGHKKIMFKEIATIVGLSVERIRQKEAQALRFICIKAVNAVECDELAFMQDMEKLQ